MTSNPDHSQRAHAKLGASGAHRWMKCPAAPRMEGGMPDSPSPFAAEGTAAHELADMTLNRDHLECARYIGEEIIVDEMTFTVDRGMADHVQTYVDTVMSYVESGDTMLVEQRFTLNKIAEGMFGTNDAIVLKHAARKMVVLDLKYGRGVTVEATDNVQLQYYALGALLEHGHDSFDEVEVVIVQPRGEGDSIKRWTIDTIDLLDFEARLLAAAARTKDPNAQPNAGSWCRFCKAAAICPAMEAEAMRAAEIAFSKEGFMQGQPPEPEGLDPERLSNILHQLDTLEKWMKAVRAYAHNRLEIGQELPGWKLVDKRATRRWKDEETARDALHTAGFNDAELYEQNFLTPAAAEKLVGKAAFKEDFREIVESVSSGTTMAPDDDKRPSVSPTAVWENAPDVNLNDL